MKPIEEWRKEFPPDWVSEEANRRLEIAFIIAVRNEALEAAARRAVYLGRGTPGEDAMYAKGFQVATRRVAEAIRAMKPGDPSPARGPESGEGREPIRHDTGTVYCADCGGEAMRLKKEWPGWECAKCGDKGPFTAKKPESKEIRKP